LSALPGNWRNPRRLKGRAVMMLAIWLQLSVEPPWWVHVLLWVPLTVAGVVGGLRLTKGWLLAREYTIKGDERQRGDGA
jgi:uncharacterized protein (DUF983 family)